VSVESIKLDYLSDGRNVFLGTTLLVLGVLGTLLMVWRYHQEDLNIAQQEALVSSIRSARVSRSDRMPVEKDSEQIVLETNQAKAIILELNLPWKELFEAIESYRKEDVAVLTIEPDAQKSIVRINAEAKSLESMTGYLAYLQQLPLFRDVELMNHQVQEQDPQQPVRFMIQASWGAHP
jgi:Tfp pilus assembly protein PilN